MHGIIIHRGTGNDGHYYALIYDRNAGVWYRFDDYKVSVETEEQVMIEGFGDVSKRMSAYSLIYINDEIAAT